MGHNLKAKEVLLYKPYQDRKNNCVDTNKSLAFRCVWMLFYSYILKCRSSYATPNRPDLIKHITDALELCLKFHPNSQLAIAIKKQALLQLLLG